MRVRAIRTAYRDCPPEVAAFGGPETQTYISLGNTYEVHAISVYEGIVHLQIINDLNIIVWKPAWFFEMESTSVPKDWICNLFQDNPTMVLGPEFVAAGLASYASMVELDDDQVQRFRRRLEKLKTEGE